MAENHRDFFYTRRNGVERPASTGMYFSAAWESKLHELVVSIEPWMLVTKNIKIANLAYQWYDNGVVVFLQNIHFCIWYHSFRVIGQVECLCSVNVIYIYIYQNADYTLHCWLIKPLPGVMYLCGTVDIVLVVIVRLRTWWIVCHFKAICTGSPIDVTHTLYYS